MMRMMKKLLGILCFCLLAGMSPVQAAEAGHSSAFHEQYQLEKMLVLSRHNIRSPLGSKLQQLTPHTWFSWTSAPGELSLRGGQLETIMGQYFRKYLVQEGLMQENEQPREGEMRFYANSMQRTIATAQYFSSGMLPVANVRIEHKFAPSKMDPVFNPVMTFMSDAYQAEIQQEMSAMGGPEGLQGIGRRLSGSYQLLEEVLDLKQSQAAKTGQLAHFRTDDVELVTVLGDGPYVLHSLQTAIGASDALVLQYYEEENADKAAFGHRLTMEQWQEISRVKDDGMDFLCGAPPVAVNLAHPLLQVMQDELALDTRKFTFLCGHDSNLTSVLAALEAEPYALPQSVERKTPIGSKIVIEKWRGRDGAAYASVNLVYQSAEQLRSRTMLSLDTPPMIYPLSFTGLTKNADGLYLFTDVQQRFQKALDAYDRMAREAQEPAA